VYYVILVNTNKKSPIIIEPYWVLLTSYSIEAWFYLVFSKFIRFLFREIRFPNYISP